MKGKIYGIFTVIYVTIDTEKMKFEERAYLKSIK